MVLLDPVDDNADSNDDKNDSIDDDPDQLGWNEADTNFSTQLNLWILNYQITPTVLTHLPPKLIMMMLMMMLLMMMTIMMMTVDDDNDYDDTDGDALRTTCMFNTLSCTSSKMSSENCRTNSARTRKLSRSLLWPAPT